MGRIILNVVSNDVGQWSMRLKIPEFSIAEGDGDWSSLIDTLGKMREFHEKLNGSCRQLVKPKSRSFQKPHVVKKSPARVEEEEITIMVPATKSASEQVEMLKEAIEKRFGGRPKNFHMELLNQEKNGDSRELTYRISWEKTGG